MSLRGEFALEALIVPVDLGDETATNVRVWAVDLDRLAALDGIFSGWLSVDEHERSSRFQFIEHQRHFQRCRGVLRWLLGQWLDCEPASIRFAYGPMGKPKLGGAEANRVYFNLSHSGSLALYAISGTAEVGVDVEFIRPMPEAEAILGRFLAKPVAAGWALLPENERMEEFFRHWVRREAILKWCGSGLAESDAREVDLPRGCVEVCFRPSPHHLAVLIHGSL